jgi:N-acetylmuramoyl-L-alanine amidase
MTGAMRILGLDWHASRRAPVLLCLVLVGTAGLVPSGAPARAEEKPTVTAVRVSTIDQVTRITLSLSATVRYRVSVVGQPYRLVLDMPGVRWDLEPVGRFDSGAVRAWRFGAFTRDIDRVVFDLDRPMRVQKTFALAPKDRTTEWRLVIDLERVSRDEFERLEREREGRAPAPPPAHRAEPPVPVAAPPPAGRPALPLIVLDPGHGGVDPGAVGPGGTVEKAIVLALAKDVAERLVATGRYRAMLTRGGDNFVPLRQRFEAAREARAGLFLSLHADSNPIRGRRGVSVYTLSTEATDQEAAALAKRENRSDEIAGLALKGRPGAVAGVLIELAQRDTKAKSIRLARSLVAELRSVAPLVGKPHRAAGFAVLKAPDVPSVLIEVGHLSNAEEEKKLADPAYRKRLAEGIARGIDRYFAVSRPKAGEPRAAR